MSDYYTICIWTLISLESLIYIITGILLFIRSSKRAIFVRSPKLLQISHWSNFTEVLIVLTALNIYQGYNESYNTVLILCTVIHFLTHYLFFIPFILRSFRLYTIYKVHKELEIEEKDLLMQIKRTKEKFLLKILALVSLPFVLICILAYTVSHEYNFLEYSNKQAEKSNMHTIVNSIALVIGFAEQIICIFAINALRNVIDDFKMNFELCFVNLVWVITSPNLILNNYSYFSYQILIRNNLVFLISSLYPLLLTYKAKSFDMPLTDEVLKSLALILNHKFTLEAFDAFLKTLPVQLNCYLGTDYLELWFECELCKTDPSTYIPKLNQSLDKLKLPDSSLESLQSSAFTTLEKVFYPLFINSPQYLSCIKEVNRQKLYFVRLHLTRENYDPSNLLI